MKLYRSLNLLDNEKLIKKLNLWSLALTVLFFLLFIALAVFLKPSFTFNYSLRQLFFILILLVGFVLLHEVIHAFFFKWFNPKGKVRFGFKSGMAYATSPGSLYRKNPFLVIVLAPFVVITLLLVILLWMNVLSPEVFIIIGTFHSSACIGDFYYVYLLLRLPKDVQVEDTSVGIDFYFPEKSSFWLDNKG
ncbi:DUF3267 domain-containing protein [Vagococcus sp.]|uniref:DUF3267 domain-containing protein n=1 Tax=Vagococcus sp. TaxID=1933889 RepID=UPI003F9BC400